MLACLPPGAAEPPPPRMEPVPARRADEGQGPFRKLVICGAMLIVPR